MLEKEELVIAKTKGTRNAAFWMKRIWGAIPLHNSHMGWENMVLEDPPKLQIDKGASNERAKQSRRIAASRLVLLVSPISNSMASLACITKSLRSNPRALRVFWNNPTVSKLVLASTTTMRHSDIKDHTRNCLSMRHHREHSRNNPTGSWLDF